jgi:hypothetical protein
LHWLSSNHKCTQSCYFSPATQTRCSEGEDGLEFFDEEFLVHATLVVVPVVLWSLPLFYFFKSHLSL